MANPQKENGFTAISNELLEAFCKYQFPPKASVPPRIVLHIIRKTYGYQKKKDIISLSQFQEAIGERNRSNLVYWLNYLVQARILIKNKISNMQVEYGLNKNYEEWLPLVQVMKLVQVRHWGSASDDTETSASNDTYKRKKEKTKETTEHSSGEIAVLIKAFEEINPNAKNFYARPPQRKACQELITTFGFDRIKKIIETTLPRTNKMEYMPTITTPIQLLEKWSSLEAGVLKLKGKQKEKPKVAFQ